MDLIPDRAHYDEARPVIIEFSVPAPDGGVAVVTKLNEVIRTVPVASGATTVDLGSFGRGGYGVHLGESATAFDVVDDPFDRPRYGFVVKLSDDVVIDDVVRLFRRLHLDIAQFYDWGYQHSQLVPPSELYVDPLGQERRLSIVNAMAESLAAAGVTPLGYSAVYAVGSDEVSDWQGSVLFRNDGAPYRLGENFLILVDPAEPRWLEHYLGELERVVTETRLHGFHLDQYGWPKFAVRADGVRVDLAASFVTLIEAVRERMPDARFMFNNVNDFGTHDTAPAPQDATYIEVWDPHSQLQDLATLATAARAARREHPPILSAYLSCYTEGEARANNAAALVMATAFSHGATHLLMGENGRALIDPYYPNNHGLAAESVDFFARWYDFAVRYGDLLFDAGAQDVTESFTGGINEDVVVAGVPVSTKAQAGHVWTRVVRTPLGLVIHLVNLLGQTETSWDAGKNDPVRQSGVTVDLSLVGEQATLFFATVEEPEMVPLTATGMATRDQHDALSAGQSSVRFELPDFGAWAMLFLPASEYLG